MLPARAYILVTIQRTRDHQENRTPLALAVERLSALVELLAVRVESRTSDTELE